jgi:hypothetical protein
MVRYNLQKRFSGLCPSSIFHKNLQRFGNWIFFRLQVKKTGRTETVAVGPPGWASLRPQPGGPTARVSALPFYLKTEEDPASETL